jgi:adenine-specific DNA-methyltransferase
MYVFFIERASQILKKEGQFTFIIPNKWMRAGYGENLRKWLKTIDIQAIIDFGDLPVFEEATTYPCIFSFQNKKVFTDSLMAVNIKTLDFPESLYEYVRLNEFEVSVKQYDDKEGWVLSDSDIQNLLQKIRSTGKPLSEYVNNQVFRGVLTGLNEAFVIDESTRQQLIDQDPRSAEIIKPFLAGRDVKRYQYLQADKHLIFTRRGIIIENYESIEKYLLQFKERLTPKPKNHKGDWSGRKEGGYKWYEIQDAVDYYSEFEKVKIVYPNICRRPEFAFDEENLYTNQKCFIISNFLLGVLNSNVMYFLFKNLLPELRGGFYEPNYAIFKNFPIPVATKEQQQPIINLVEKILSLKKENPQADTQVFEDEIDELVFGLYGLSAAERAVVLDG